MSQKTICKTIHQYNSAPVCKEDMSRLLEIAKDYTKVKNYVYQCYGGISSLPKLYPGYTIQNEMTRTGLRETLGLPSVYFYVAIFDALGDIKSQWTRIKFLVLQRVNRNEELTPEEKHFLRFTLKVNNAFAMALNHEPIVLPNELQRQYEQLAGNVDKKKLDNYLRRQVRMLRVKMKSDNLYGFSLTERAYRYDDHGIYITIKEKRKRIFIPLTDNNQYKRQIYIRLFPETGNVEINVPVEVTVRKHGDYMGKVGLAVGMYRMLVTDEGHVYGERLGEIQETLAVWVREQTRKYRANLEAGNRPGRKKYMAKKKRLEEQLHSYINMELNRFIQTEKPEIVYIPKLPPPKKHGGQKTINHAVTMWQRGYIRKRLIQKCGEQSVTIVEVYAKDISNVCSQCGAPGKKADGNFSCFKCGYEADEKINSARNAKKRGMEQVPVFKKN